MKKTDNLNLDTAKKVAVNAGRIARFTTTPGLQDFLERTVFILGADDPEMEVVKALLEGAGATYVEATIDGQRVNPRTAYQLGSLTLPDGGPIHTVVLVECGFREGFVEDGKVAITATNYFLDGVYGRAIEEFGPTGAVDGGEFHAVTSHAEVIVVDHHRPGDPGFGRRGEEGSSLFQVIDLLEREMGASIRGTLPEEDLYPLHLVAASDHNPAAAYRGEMKVKPEDLRTFRLAVKAAFQGREVTDLIAACDKAVKALRTAPKIKLGDMEVADLRGTYVSELPEAALYTGAAYLAEIADRDGREKVVVGGCASPAAIKAFIEEWAPAHNLIDAYGVPTRGFAGAYKKA